MLSSGTPAPFVPRPEKKVVTFEDALTPEVAHENAQAIKMTLAQVPKA